MNPADWAVSGSRTDGPRQFAEVNPVAPAADAVRAYRRA